jgi:hypothetical protein
MHVTPIYGNGWTDGVATIDEPLPFQIVPDKISDAGKVSGVVVSRGHALFGCHFEASLRFDGDNSHYNCRLHPDAAMFSGLPGPDLQGYCMISTLEAD